MLGNAISTYRRPKPQTLPQGEFLLKEAATKNRRIKVLSYNIHSAIGRDKAYRLDRIIDVLRSEEADVIALQEVDNNLTRSNHDDQSRIIANALGMHYHHCVNYSFERGTYGITTLSRFPIIRKRRDDLSYKKRLQPRGSLYTALEVEKNLFLHIFNVHLGLRVRERSYQRKRLLDRSVLLDESLNDPVVVLGDFNDRPVSVVHKQLRNHFTDVMLAQEGKNPATFAWGPVRFRLDYIYVSDQLSPVMTYVVKNEQTLVASDHLPVASVLQLPFYYS